VIEDAAPPRSVGVGVRIVVAGRPGYLAFGGVLQVMRLVDFEEIGALPHLPAIARVRGLPAVGNAGRERMQILPFAEILRTVEENAAALYPLARADAAVPAVRFLPHAWVAKARDAHAFGRFRDHGSLELLPVEQPVVFGCGQHLRFAQLVVRIAEGDLVGRGVLHAGVNEGRHAVIDDRRPAEAPVAVRAAGRGRQGNRLVAPVHHVWAYGVAPVHVAPHSRIGIELVKEVVLALPPDGPVGIVHPVVRGQQVVLGAKRIAGEVGAFGTCARTSRRQKSGPGHCGPGKEFPTAQNGTERGHPSTPTVRMTAGQL